MSAPHALLFLDPGHFHAGLTLRVPHPRVADEIVVYAPDGPERRDFLALIDRFNGRPDAPTRWRPDVVTSGDPLARLVDERRGDVVVLAGRNGGKAHTIRRLHESGFHVLADKPWLVDPDDLPHVQASLAGWPLAMEIMTGRHDVAARLWARLVGTREVFGAFRPDGPAIEFDSVHHLQKLVDGAPLRRPWWFFDVRVQGTGGVDIPTHLVDRTQWLLEAQGAAPGEIPRLLSARLWPTLVPVDAFRAITGEPGFPPELKPVVDGDALSYTCNAQIEYRLGAVTARAATRWALAPPPGGGDSSRSLARGLLADIALEQGAHTGHRPRITVEPGAAGSSRALAAALAAWQAEFPGVGVQPASEDRHEVIIPPGLDGGHEAHFARVLDEFLKLIDGQRWPAAVAQRTLAKYTLLSEVAARPPRPIT